MSEKDKDKLETVSSGETRLAKNRITVDTFLSNSVEVKQFSKLNEIAFKKKYLELYRKNPEANPYYRTESEWRNLFQAMIGVKFKK